MRWAMITVLAAASAAGAVAARAAAPQLTAQQIMARNVAARGGEEAWRRIQTMIWIGHLENTGGATPSVPFVLEQKRPNKTRFELNAMGQRTLRVFDGRRGWKVHRAADGRPDVVPFTPQELRFAEEAVVIDSPLIEHEARHISVQLDGIDQVEGRKAYRLIARTPSNERHDVWVDAKTFLDVKYDRVSYSPAGTPRTVSMTFRDYQTVEGVKIPAVIEIGSGTGQAPERMVIEKIAVNPVLDERLFARPGGPSRRTTVTIEPDYGPLRRSAAPVPTATPGAALTAPAAPPPAVDPPPK